MMVYAITDTKKGEQGLRLLIFKLPKIIMNLRNDVNQGRVMWSVLFVCQSLIMSGWHNCLSCSWYHENSLMYSPHYLTNKLSLSLTTVSVRVLIYVNKQKLSQSEKIHHVGVKLILHIQ